MRKRHTTDCLDTRRHALVLEAVGTAAIATGLVRSVRYGRAPGGFGDASRLGFRAGRLCLVMSRRMAVNPGAEQ